MHINNMSVKPLLPMANGEVLCENLLPFVVRNGGLNAQRTEHTIRTGKNFEWQWAQRRMRFAKPRSWLQIGLVRHHLFQWLLQNIRFSPPQALYIMPTSGSSLVTGHHQKAAFETHSRVTARFVDAAPGSDCVYSVNERWHLLDEVSAHASGTCG